MSQIKIVAPHKGKSRYWVWVTGLLLHLTGIATHLHFQGEIITLRAGEPLALGANPALPPIGTNLVATLNNNEEAQVVECRDIKSDLVIRLRTKTGKTGYVAGGNYILIRKNPRLFSMIYEFDLVTFSCRGMYEKRSLFLKE